MTKRLEIATQVLQGILANPHNRDSFTDKEMLLAKYKDVPLYQRKKTQ